MSRDGGLSDTDVVGIVLAVAAFGALVGVVAFVLSTGGERIGGSGDMLNADAEARARSAGIDHLTRPSG